MDLNRRYDHGEKTFYNKGLIFEAYGPGCLRDCPKTSL